MSLVNCVTIIGNLGQNPEARTTGGGTQVATLSVATNERVKKDDQWQDHTEWHRVVCFGKTAENAAKHLTKGRQVAVSGKLRTQKWTDKEGRERYTTEIIADEIKYLGANPGERRDEPGRPTSGGDDDIPF